VDSEEYERRQRVIEELAANEGADYFDADSPIIWKRYIIGPVPRWRRLLWWFFPPSHAKMRRIAQRQSDRMWREATENVTGSRTPTTSDVSRVAVFSMLPPVMLSALGPIYYGYMGEPYWRVLVWAGVCAILGLWFYRNSFAVAFKGYSYPSAVKILNVVAIVVFMALSFLAGDSVVYFIVRSISR
jgi:hypothetical protein